MQEQTVEFGDRVKQRYLYTYTCTHAVLFLGIPKMKCSHMNRDGILIKNNKSQLSDC
jgi:hypothetical protein